MIIILQILYFMNKSINFIRRLHASDVMAAQRTHLETMSTSLNRVVLRKLLFGVIIIKYEFLLNTLHNDFKKLASHFTLIGIVETSYSGVQTLSLIP